MLESLPYAENWKNLANYKWDVIGISETRWPGTGEVTTDNGHNLFYIGQDKVKSNGIRFLVRK